MFIPYDILSTLSYHTISLSLSFFALTGSRLHRLLMMLSIMMSVFLLITLYWSHGWKSNCMGGGVAELYANDGIG